MRAEGRRAAVVLLLTVLAGAWPATGPAGAASQEVELQGVRFVPAHTTVRAGETVTWVHHDSGLNHHVAADDGSFDSHPTCGRPGGVCMKGGDTYARTFSQPGTWGYHCRLHGRPGQGMVGVVKVLSR